MISVPNSAIIATATTPMAMAKVGWVKVRRSNSALSVLCRAT